jgi:hypothetical protein
MTLWSSIIPDTEAQTSPHIDGADIEPQVLVKPLDQRVPRIVESQGALGLSVTSGNAVHLAWRDLTVSVNGATHVVLDGLTGLAEPGRLLAIMGPSFGLW